MIRRAELKANDVTGWRGAQRAQRNINIPEQISSDTCGLSAPRRTGAIRLSLRVTDFTKSSASPDARCQRLSLTLGHFARMNIFYGKSENRADVPGDSPTQA
jgi:hypothetical protein